VRDVRGFHRDRRGTVLPTVTRAVLLSKLCFSKLEIEGQSMRSGNPAMRESIFQSADAYAPSSATMTIAGTTTKTGILLLLAGATSAVSWNLVVSNSPLAIPAIVGGAIVGLILALITCFFVKAAPVTAPLYALAEGFLLGGVSALYNARFQGLVGQAVLLTFGTAFMMLVAYRTGWIRATEKFKAGVFAATGAICLLYLVSFVMSLFGNPLPIHNNSLLSIGFSVVVVIVAALNLVIDFDFIEEGSRAGLSKSMEWYGAFALMVTLVWLYLEILRLLSKISSRN